MISGQRPLVSLRIRFWVIGLIIYHKILSFWQHANIALQEKWSEWSYDMNIAVGALCPDMRQLMEYVEVHGEKSFEQLKAEHPDERSRYEGLEKVNSELFELWVVW